MIPHIPSVRLQPQRPCQALLGLLKATQLYQYPALVDQGVHIVGADPDKTPIQRQRLFITPLAEMQISELSQAALMFRVDLQGPPVTPPRFIGAIQPYQGGAHIDISLRVIRVNTDGVTVTFQRILITPFVELVHRPSLQIKRKVGVEFQGLPVTPPLQIGDPALLLSLPIIRVNGQGVSDIAQGLVGAPYQGGDVGHVIVMLRRRLPHHPRHLF